MAEDVYLIRKNQQWVKYSDIVEVTLTGAIGVFGNITSVLGTITVPGSALVVNSQVTFASITGGNGLTAGTAYWVITASGTSITLSATRGGSAVNVTTNITAGTILVQTDEMRVWSTEFRDIFSAGTLTQALIQDAGTSSASVTGAASAIVLDTATLVDNAGVTGVKATVSSSTSDEIKHQPLRQTLLNRTHWKFDKGSGVTNEPRYLYAEWVAGDMVANNPPATA